MALILLILYTSLYHIYKTILTATITKLYTRVIDRLTGDQERNPTSKGPLTGVKCKQRNAHTSVILPVFSKSQESISL